MLCDLNRLNCDKGVINCGECGVNAVVTETKSQLMGFLSINSNDFCWPDLLN